MNARDRKTASLPIAGRVRGAGCPPARGLTGLVVSCFAVWGCWGCGRDRARGLESIEVFVDPAKRHVLRGSDVDRGEIALTFDDGPADPETTRAILRTLDKYKVKAVFFQVGRHAERHPDVTQEILRRGHSLGSHSWDHADLTTLPRDEANGNIERGHLAVMRAANTGALMPFFRFPYLASNAAQRRAVRKMGLISFEINMNSKDYDTPDPDELLVQALAEVDEEKRGIIVFHDIQPQTAKMLDAFLHELQARGYGTVVFRARPTQLSDWRRPQLPVAAAGLAFPGWGMPLQSVLEYQSRPAHDVIARALSRF